MSARGWDVGVLGATGIVGQQLMRRLDNHPWFRVAWLGASERSAGRRYGDLPWLLSGTAPAGVRDLVVDAPIAGRPPQLVFSALDAAAAATIEPAFASAGHAVVSNARTFRLEADVPLVVPEVNPGQLALIGAQRQRRGWPGSIVTNPNCSTVFLALALAALRSFRPRRVMVTTLQAASGAGYPGVPSWDLLGNVIPFIDGEEEKIESETPKILGTVDGDRVIDHCVRISATATRVPVLDGHTESVSVEFDVPPQLADLAEAFRQFRGRPDVAELPSAPSSPLVLCEAANRPQPRLDADAGGGMSVSIGRLRRCPLFHARFVALGHNTVRGAAGAAVLNAELLATAGWLSDGVTPW
ncbi:MAG: aspartate-semialdehyde dehydrogenase [Vicinamibacterales bacterium]|nr:aspartate-semialdehyde dehydrogenase [Vicinamibacterales bacterium]